MLPGKTAIVTGSTSGIGLGIAEALAAGGANVVLNGFGDAAAIETLRSRLAREHNVGVSYVGADIGKPGDVAAMIEAAQREFGGVDILVNSAGIQHVAPVEEFPVEKWDAILGINLSGTFHAIRLAVPGMKKKGWGRIINIASAHALVASPFKSAYVAAKHGVLGLTRTVALEVAEHGITVNAICPGMIDTELTHEYASSDLLDRLAAGYPVPRLGTALEVADLICFAASEAAGYITGASFDINGGDLMM